MNANWTAELSVHGQSFPKKFYQDLWDVAIQFQELQDSAF